MVRCEIHPIFLKSYLITQCRWSPCLLLIQSVAIKKDIFTMTRFDINYFFLQGKFKSVPFYEIAQREQSNHATFGACGKGARQRRQANIETLYINTRMRIVCSFPILIALRIKKGNKKTGTSSPQFRVNLRLIFIQSTRWSDRLLLLLKWS